MYSFLTELTRMVDISNILFNLKDSSCIKTSKTLVLICMIKKNKPQTSKVNNNFVVKCFLFVNTTIQNVQKPQNKLQCLEIVLLYYSTFNVSFQLEPDWTNMHITNKDRCFLSRWVFWSSKIAIPKDVNVGGICCKGL